MIDKSGAKYLDLCFGVHATKGSLKHEKGYPSPKSKHFAVTLLAHRIKGCLEDATV